MTWVAPKGWKRTRQLVFARWGRVCWRCGGYATTVDHVTPVALGGTHDPENLRPACRRCNYGGGARITNSRRGGRNQVGRAWRTSRQW